MHRFFVSPESLQDGQVMLPEAQAHQVRDVLRLRAGEAIAVLDNSGAEYRVELTTVTRSEVSGRVVETLARSREPRLQLVLYQSLLKGEKLEWVLQKGTELGIAAFVPVQSARTVAETIRRSRRARWERIMVEAAEQSGRSKIPPLRDVQLFASALEDAAISGGLSLIPWEEEQVADLRAVLHDSHLPERVNLFIGPEGGYRVEEIEQARAQGAVAITLGSRILRAETAGLVAASAIFYACGELNAR